MRRVLSAMLVVCLGLGGAVGVGTPAHADDVEDALQAALDAYRDGDIALAKEEADFASALLAEQKASGLSAFLPEPFSGWTRTDGDQQAVAAQVFGGGLMANAVYDGPSGSVEIQMMADSPVVAGIGAMFSSPAMMAAQGSVKRIGREKILVTPDGDVSSLIGGRVLVQISGSAPVEDKEAYFAEIDARGLAAF